MSEWKAVRHQEIPFRHLVRWGCGLLLAGIGIGTCGTLWLISALVAP